MKTIGLTLIALGLALAALPAGAQGQTSFTLEAHSEGGGGYFTLEGETARNPTLNVAPGETITITLKAADSEGVHNVKVDGEAAGSEYVTALDETVTYTFTAPTTGTKEYFCEPHRGAGMKGLVSAGGSTATTSTGENGGGQTNGSPGFELVGALVALAGLALVLRRK